MRCITPPFAAASTCLCCRPNLCDGSMIKSAPNCLIMPQATAPHGAGGGPGHKKPPRLDGERLEEIGAFEAFEENGDRAEELVIEREPFHRRLAAHGHDVDREHLAAEEIFEQIGRA